MTISLIVADTLYDVSDEELIAELVGKNALIRTDKDGDSLTEDEITEADDEDDDTFYVLNRDHMFTADDVERLLQSDQ